MPLPTTPHSRVCETLREELLIGRDCGESFDDAWAVAARRAVGIAAYRDRSIWREVLAQTRDTWRAAYDREDPCAGSRALLALEEVVV
jgi:hypothetical protein